MADRIVIGILEKVLFAANELRKRIQALDEIYHERNQLKDCAETLLQILEGIQTQQNDASYIPVAVEESLVKVQSILDHSIRTCEAVNARTGPFEKAKEIWKAKETTSMLFNVCHQLQMAIGILNACLGMTTHEIVKELHHKIDDVEGVARNPYAGIYQETACSNVLKAPAKVEKPVVVCDGDLVRVEWYDKCNLPGSLNSYELQYDDQTTHSNLTLNPNCTAVKLGTPVLKQGKAYTIRVRGINNQGPGEWSESTVCHFLPNCPPEQPPKPVRVQISSDPTSATLLVSTSVLQSKTRDPVTAIIVEYCDDNSSVWSSNIYSTEQLDYNKGRSNLTLDINDLGDDTYYRFRIKLRNRAGDSLPSDDIEAKTDQPTPGIPIGLRVSSKRTTTRIKIRWEEPRNSHVVDHYEIERTAAKRGFSEIKKSNTLSAKFTQLESNSKFYFRVRAVNKAGQYGDWSEPIKAKTRQKGAKKAKAITAGIGAGLGGFLASPVAVAGGLAVSAGMLAVECEKKKDHGMGAKVAAGSAAAVAGGVGGAILGTIAAPFSGIATGIATTAVLLVSDTSPQTSDDEGNSNEGDVLSA